MSALKHSVLFAAALSLGATLALPAQAGMTLVRLTPAQYRQSIHDIFGNSIHIGQNRVDPGFRANGLLAVGNRKLTVGSVELERDEILAQEIAAQVLDATHREVLVGCGPRSEVAADDSCTRSFVRRVGLRLFRRPLTAEETRGFVATEHQAAQRLHSFNAGLAAALARMLVAPQFLFRVELSTPEQAHPDLLQLDPYARATRLSYFLWNTTPDDALLAAARSGALMSPRGLQQQVDRLLSSPRTEQGLRAFFIDMLGFGGLDQDPGFDTLSIDTSFYPKFTANVQSDAEEQTLRTIVDQLLYRDQDYRDLFTSRDTFLTPALAAVYNVPLPRSQELGGAIPWVPYHYADSDPYLGILSQISFLSLHSHPGRTSPTRRGKALREIFLCQRVPPPPGNVDFSLVQNTNDPRYKTVRQRLTAHRKEPMCAGCHKITDPIGLALENFDTAAEFRTTENGATIDASGELNGRKFDGLRQLAQVIHDDPATSSCLIDRVYSYGTDRKPTSQEQAWLTQLQHQLLAGSGIHWRALMRAIALNPAFYSMPRGPSTLTAQVSH